MLGSVGQDVGCLGGFQPVGWGLRTASGAFSSSCEQITARRMAVGSIRSSAKRGRHVSKALAQIAAVARRSAAASTSSAASASGMLALPFGGGRERHNLGRHRQQTLSRRQQSKCEQRTGAYDAAKNAAGYVGAAASNGLPHELSTWLGRRRLPSLPYIPIIGPSMAWTVFLPPCPWG